MSDFEYIGDELELFAEAKVWKAYLGAQIRPYLGKRVLEVRACIGGTTESICRTPGIKSWTCLEPDQSLCQTIDQKISSGVLPSYCSVTCGTIWDTLDTYDTLLYIDVLEHIEDDRSELERALTKLIPFGHLVVLSPAHQYLFGPLDQAVGHNRRYNRKMMAQLDLFILNIFNPERRSVMF